MLGVQDGLTYCGERKFRITSTGHENYLSYNEFIETLTLLATDNADIGADILVTIEAYLVDYDIPSLRSSATFTVTIDPCPLVLTESPTDVQTVDYTLGDESVTTAAYSFDQGSCDYTFSTSVDSTPPLPSYITHDSVSQTLIIAKVTDLSTQGDTYTITVSRLVT